MNKMVKMVEVAGSIALWSSASSLSSEQLLGSPSTREEAVMYQTLLQRPRDAVCMSLKDVYQSLLIGQ